MSAGQPPGWPGDPVGYTDVWSAAPGDRVRCMVSTSASSYRASLVRLGGNRPEFEVEVPSVIDGEDRGRVQQARAGSCAAVEGADPVATLETVSARVWVWPTLPAQGREQVLLGSGSWALLLDGAGRPCLRVLTVGDGPVELQACRPLAAREWVLVCASHDAIRGQLLLHVVREGPYKADPETASRVVTASPLRRGSASVFIAVGGVRARERGRGETGTSMASSRRPPSGAGG